MEDQRPYGIIYPVSEEHAMRVLKQGKSVFVKYTPHEVVSDRMASCKKLLFYISGGDMQVAGEAEIERIELLSKEEILERYSSALFLSKRELESYARSRTKRLLAFMLTHPRLYRQGVQFDHYLTMNGEYIELSDYERLTK